MHSERFFELLGERDSEAVLRALAEEPALASARDPYLSSTPLHFAAHRGMTDVVSALLLEDVDVDAREGASDTTALHWAAEGGHPAIARLLVARGAALEPLDGWHALGPLGWATVVTWAPQYHEDKPKTAAYLLEAGARLDVFSAVAIGKPATLRELAVARGLSDSAALLVDLGADVEARTLCGLTPLAVALRRKDSDAAAFLRSKGARDDAGCAVVTGNAAALENLLRSREAERLADRLLFVAVEIGDARVVEALLRLGADANTTLRRLLGELPADVAPLQEAARHGRVDVARSLLDAGARASVGAEDGRATPLHLAAANLHPEIVGLLLERGADPSARDAGFGATPLAWAELSEDEDATAARRAVVLERLRPVTPADAD